jgi:DNA polymerase-3 subunit delta'
MWEGVIGQPRAVAQLERAVARPGHAYLLAGPSGSGLDEAARELAARLVADSIEPDTRTLDLVRRGLHVDVCEFEPEGTYFLVDQADEVIHEAVRAPVDGVRKVLMLHDVDRMNEASGNRLLKTIEEPPDRTVFVLTTERPDEVLDTIRSRCQRVDLSPLSETHIVEALTAAEVEADIAALAASLAGGHLTRARSLAGPWASLRRAFAGVPARIDGSGAGACAIVDDLEAAIARVTAAADELQRQQSADLDEELERRGYEGRAAQTQRRRLAARHKRESARLRRDLLLEGITAIESVYRDALCTPAPARNLDLAAPDVSPTRCAGALEACRHARDAALVNEKGTLHLLHLVLALPRPGARA